MGLMQVMPGTYAELRARHNLGPDPFDPHENIMAGVAYMREMYDMYGSPGFLAAYNAGPNRLDDYLANQRALPDETRHYVAAIGPSLRYAPPRVRSPAEQFAMNQLPLNIPPGPRYGYGSVQVPTIQLSAAAPSIAAGVHGGAASTGLYPARSRRAVAWAQPHPAGLSRRRRSPQPPARRLERRRRDRRSIRRPAHAYRRRDSEPWSRASKSGRGRRTGSPAAHRSTHHCRDHAASPSHSAVPPQHAVAAACT